MTIDYDVIAANYAKYREASPRIIDEIVKETKGREVNTVLEVGCGTGNHLKAVADSLRAAAIGIDSSSKMLAEAARRYPDLTLLEADAEGDGGLPLPDHCADVVMSVDFIHYIDEFDRYFTEAYRVLRRDRLVVTVTDSADDIEGRTMSRYFPESRDNELRRYPRIKTLTEAMERAGFVEVRATSTVYRFLIDEAGLERYRGRSYSALRLITDECFRSGIEQMERDVARGCCQGVERYTYLWGLKDRD